jgi:glucoamylase
MKTAHYLYDNYLHHNRATALMIAANSLIANGEMDYVKQYLWTGDSNKYHGGAIKYDLDYVMSNYMTSTCDLWEEIRDSDMFWNRFTMRKAMILGAQFATQMGDAASANQYTTAFNSINSTLYSSHWNGAFVQETGSRTRDGGVIVGFNDGFDSIDNLFAPTSIQVAMTVSSYNTMFCSQYTVNTNDYLAGQPGVLYGRYQGDSYAGGNPWVLTTAALGSLFYRGASYVSDSATHRFSITMCLRRHTCISKVFFLFMYLNIFISYWNNQILANGVPSTDALAVWQTAFNTAAPLPTDAKSLAQVFANQGDGVMMRLRSHVEADGGHLDEQIDRNTGLQMSAKDLTWSYAEVLNAMYYRGQYYDSL